MYKFTKTPAPDNRFDQNTVEVTTDTVSLSDLISAFQDFLRGCGFGFIGELEVVNDEPTSQESDFDAL